MSGSKHFDKLAWAVTALTLIAALLFMNGGALGLTAAAHTMGYESRLFDNTRVHTIDIVMEDWEEFIRNAAGEEYFTADLTIDGETFKNIAIRGKGNTSLSMVASSGSDRYSFKVEFDHYDSALTYHGLDKLCLNNLIQDATMMKDYLTYTLMAEFGVCSPLCSFVYITVNGEDWGLYLAVEGVEESFLERNYGRAYGELYKPDSMSMGGGRGNGKDFRMDDFMQQEKGSGSAAGDTPVPGSMDPAMSRMPEHTQDDPGDRTPPSSGGKGAMGASDVKLQYIDDDVSSYTNIWNNAKTDITTADQERLMESLKKLSEGEALASVVNMDQVIRYFVVHNYVCNGDSYTGSMIHNYYLYEENGHLSMIPWDYNLAFGAFQGSDGQSTVNTPIDAPVSGGSGEDRPMWNWILSDSRYTQQYHQYFDRFLRTVDVQAIIDNAHSLIRPWVSKDPSAFYTCEEFETGVDTLRQFCTLRSESILLQLKNGETTTNMDYADASGLTISHMGSMGAGHGGAPGANGDRGAFGNRPESDGSSSPSPGADPNASAGLTDRNAAASGQLSQTGMPPEMPEEPDPSRIQAPFGGGFPGQPFPEGEGIPADAAGAGSQNGLQPSRDTTQPPGAMAADDPAAAGPSRVWLAVSILILAAGLLAAKFYKP